VSEIKSWQEIYPATVVVHYCLSCSFNFKKCLLFIKNRIFFDTRCYCIFAFDYEKKNVASPQRWLKMWIIIMLRTIYNGNRQLQWFSHWRGTLDTYNCWTEERLSQLFSCRKFNTTFFYFSFQIKGKRLLNIVFVPRVSLYIAIFKVRIFYSDLRDNHSTVYSTSHWNCTGKSQLA